MEKPRSTSTLRRALVILGAIAVFPGSCCGLGGAVATCAGIVSALDEEPTEETTPNDSGESLYPYDIWPAPSNPNASNSDGDC